MSKLSNLRELDFLHHLKPGESACLRPNIPVQVLRSRVRKWGKANGIPLATTLHPEQGALIISIIGNQGKVQ